MFRITRSVYNLQFDVLYTRKVFDIPSEQVAATIGIHLTSNIKQVLPHRTTRYMSERCHSAQKPQCYSYFTGSLFDSHPTNIYKSMTNEQVLY